KLLFRDALVYGLCEAKHPPVEWWWDVLTVRRVCMAYQARGSLLGLPQRIEVGAGSKPTGSKNKSGRSCTGDFLEITFTLCATLLGRKEVDLTSSEVGSKREHGRSGVENVGVVTSNLVLSELGSADAHDHSDLDSAVGLGPRSRDSTTTLSSEDFQLIQRYGRGYSRCHEGKYLLPSDKEEQERLDLQHCLFSLTLDARLHLVQLPMTHRALDIGTGTGIWSRDFAYEHPDVEVYGLDLSPMLLKWAPPNCTFQIDDLSLPWTFEFPFDFIHGRMLFCSFSNPLHVFKEAFKALTARGVMEMQDLVFEFLKIKEAFASKGIDLTSASRYRNYLETVGFEDIQQQEFIWPVGTWPTDQKSKYLGWLCQRNILDMLFAISIVPLTEYYSMSEEADLHNPEIHAYLQIVVVHGRKPKPDMFLALEG
ncbi:S-adenosyl-L-methionine-dependent methyltransferase, partial [Rhexocercosporidium sp. MPI-PUGE-AT-0058]